MSRLSQMFQSSPKASASLSDVVEKSETGFVDAIKGEDNNILDNLKPKLKEIVQEIQAEEKKLCEEAEKLDAQALLSKIPGVPALAHNLPEPLKTKIKELLARFHKTADPKKPTQIKISSMADVTDAASKLMACAGSEKPSSPSPVPKPTASSSSTSPQPNANIEPEAPATQA